MIKDRTFLAVVPARGGSKAVPRKNIRLLGGQPLLTHTLRQISQVPEIDCAVVSTDDQEIAEVTKQAGGRVILRPTELATDNAPTEWALLHALDMLEREREVFDYIVVLEPTSPFRSSRTIKKCMTRIVDRDAPSLMTVTETRSNIGRMENDRFLPLVPSAPRRRQDRQPFYIESSTVYVCRTDYLRKAKTLVTADWLTLSVPTEEAFDINTELDFSVAEAMIIRSSK